MIVFILIFIEWELAKYGINQYEDMNIKLTLSELKIARSEMEIGKQNLLKEIELDKIIIEALQKGDNKQIKDHLTQNYHGENVSKLIICNKQRKYVFGEQWELIDKYLSQIYQDISKENSGIFIGNFGNKLFQLTYNPIFFSNGTKELLGVLILVDNFDLSNLKFSSESQVSLMSYDKTLTENNLPGNLTAFISDINDLIKSMTEKHLEQSIKKFNIDNAAGIKIFYDLTNEPTGIFIISYKRYINQFVQQSILIFVLILLAVTLKVIISQKLVPDKHGKLVMIKEVLSVDSSVQAAIRNKNIGEIYQMITEGKRKGMLSMEQELFTNYKMGIITKEVAMNYANNKKRMLHLLTYSS